MATDDEIEALANQFNLSTNRDRAYSPEQIALLRTVGQQIGVAVENARLYEQAQHTAVRRDR